MGTEAKQYKERIEQMLRSVPNSVKGGSYQKSIAYKQAVERAQKALKTPNSVAKLSQACNELATFY